MLSRNFVKILYSVKAPESKFGDFSATQILHEFNFGWHFKLPFWQFFRLWILISVNFCNFEGLKFTITSNPSLWNAYLHLRHFDTPKLISHKIGITALSKMIFKIYLIQIVNLFFYFFVLDCREIWINLDLFQSWIMNCIYLGFDWLH